MRLTRILEPTLHPHPEQKIARAVLFFAVMLGMVSVIVSGFDTSRQYRNITGVVGYFLGVIFLAEYLLRILSALNHRRGKGTLRRYLFSFLGVVDFIAILPFVLPFLFPIDDELKLIINFSRVLLIFKITRYSKAFNMLGEVLNSVKTPLTLSIIIPIVFMFFAATLVFYVEHQAQPDIFRNIGDGFWWAVITMTTTGYGDIYPITPLGKVIGGLTALIGVFIIALPTGIVTSAFVSRMNRDRLVATSEKEKSSDKVGGIPNSLRSYYRNRHKATLRNFTKNYEK